MRRGRRIFRRKAFTLVEMLACLAVVSIVLPVAMEGISLATLTAGLARQQLEAANLARSKMAELTAANAWQSANLTGDFGTEWPAYSWTAHLSEYQGATLQQLDLTVNWTERGRDHAIAFSTLVYSGTGGR